MRPVLPNHHSNVYDGLRVTTQGMVTRYWRGTIRSEVSTSVDNRPTTIEIHRLLRNTLDDVSRVLIQSHMVSGNKGTLNTR